MGHIFSSRKQGHLWGFLGKEWSGQGPVPGKAAAGRPRIWGAKGATSVAGGEAGKAGPRRVAPRAWSTRGLQHGTWRASVIVLSVGGRWQEGAGVWPREPWLLAVSWAEGASSAWSSNHGPRSCPHDHPGPGGLGWRPLGVNGKAADSAKRGSGPQKVHLLLGLWVTGMMGATRCDRPHDAAPGLSRGLTAPENGCRNGANRGAEQRPRNHSRRGRVGTCRRGAEASVHAAGPLLPRRGPAPQKATVAQWDSGQLREHKIFHPRKMGAVRP